MVHDGVLTCGIVETELYQGVREDERVILEAQLDALDFLETTRGDYRAAGNVLKALRKRGITIPTPDAVIAALCLHHDLTLLERGGHFAEIEGLKCFPWRNPATLRASSLTPSSLPKRTRNYAVSSKARNLPRQFWWFGNDLLGLTLQFRAVQAEP